MNSISDDELKVLLEALHIALRVAVIYPPLEQSRIYTEMDQLWNRFGTEAISRGITDYAEYYPELEGSHSGKALEEGSDAESALEFHDVDRFWSQFTSVVAGLAAINEHGGDFPDRPFEETHPVYFEYESRIQSIIESKGIASLIDLATVIQKS